MGKAKNISAIVVAYDREEATRETIKRLQACAPAPDEILVHFDNGAFFDLPDGVKVIRSSENVGPGGGRNKLIRGASNEWVASFDDDSYPLESDYFSRVSEVVERHPDAGVIAAVIKHRNPAHDAPEPEGERQVASFVGCGCVYRRTAFLQTEGYVPLPVAYGMEEVDVSLQLHAKGYPVIESADLRVFHDTELGHHESSRITAGSIKNQALLAYLRYPVSCWPLGLAQWGNKVWDNIKRRRLIGVLNGVLGTPQHLSKYRKYRSVIAKEKIQSYRKLFKLS